MDHLRSCTSGVETLYLVYFVVPLWVQFLLIPDLGFYWPNWNYYLPL